MKRNFVYNTKWSDGTVTKVNEKDFEGGSAVCEYWIGLNREKGLIKQASEQKKKIEDNHCEEDGCEEENQEEEDIEWEIDKILEGVEIEGMIYYKV